MHAFGELSFPPALCANMSFPLQDFPATICKTLAKLPVVGGDLALRSPMFLAPL